MSNTINENEKKYASLETLQIFKENTDKLYATQENVDEISSILEEKANTSHTHNISDVTNLQSTIDEINDDISQKSQVQMITSDSSNNTTEILSTLKIHKITQEEYEENLANGTLENNAIYLTPDEEIDLSGYATIEQLNNKSDVTHNHNDIYYTETEVDVLLQDKASSTHNHDDKYDVKGSSDEALIQAKSYTDNAVVTVKNDLLNGAGVAYDTLKELGDLIDENVNAIDALEIVASNKADKIHTHNDLYYTESEIDTKISTVNTTISSSLNEAKSYSDTNLNNAKTYTDNAVAQRTQVQIITWEVDD